MKKTDKTMKQNVRKTNVFVRMLKMQGLRMKISVLRILMT